MIQRPPLINDKTMPRYTTIVTIATDNIDNAERVLNERIHYDEDYGFPYEINYDYNELQPEESTRGIIIDASVIRDKFDSLMYMLDENEPDDKRVLDAADRIKSMSDSDLNALISSTDNRRTWQLFDEMRDHIFDSVIDATLNANPS